MPQRTPTADQLRQAIDQGRAGDKVDFPDPAAAPLATDAEAAGKPPTPAERRLEASRLAPRFRGLSSDISGVLAYLAIATVIVLLILAVVLLSRAR